MFRNFAGVYNLHVGGQVIGTTAEHPFFEIAKGWTKAVDLRPGDRIVCADGSTVAVDAIVDTGNWAPVFNLRIADHHTYFVGDEAWGWAAWGHNACLIFPADTPAFVKYLPLESISGSTQKRATGIEARFTSPTQIKGGEDATYTPPGFASGVRGFFPGTNDAHARGHLLAKVLSGKNIDANIVPVWQDATNIKMRSIESTGSDSVKKRVLANETVDYVVTPHYSNASAGWPDYIHIEVKSSGGMEIYKDIENGSATTPP